MCFRSYSKLLRRTFIFTRILSPRRAHARNPILLCFLSVVVDYFRGRTAKIMFSGAVLECASLLALCSRRLAAGPGAQASLLQKSASKLAHSILEQLALPFLHRRRIRLWRRIPPRTLGARIQTTVAWLTPASTRNFPPQSYKTSFPRVWLPYTNFSLIIQTVPTQHDTFLLRPDSPRGRDIIS